MIAQLGYHFFFCKIVAEMFGSLIIYLYLYDKKNRNILKSKTFQVLRNLTHIFEKKLENYFAV